MTLIAGASRFLNQSTLTNVSGIAAVGTDVLGISANGVGILDIGRNLAVQGTGISNRARQLNLQFLSQSSGTYNQLFSAGAVSSSVDAALVQIRGLQATVPTTRDSPDVREAAAEARANAERGAVVDTQA